MNQEKKSPWLKGVMISAVMIALSQLGCIVPEVLGMLRDIHALGTVRYDNIDELSRYISVSRWVFMVRFGVTSLAIIALAICVSGHRKWRAITVGEERKDAVESKYSRSGIASFVCGIVYWVCKATAHYLFVITRRYEPFKGVSWGEPPHYSPYVYVIEILAILLLVAAFLFGISDLCQKNRKRLFEVLGIELITPAFLWQSLPEALILFSFLLAWLGR